MRIKVCYYYYDFDFAKIAKIFRFMQEKKKNISQVKQRILQFVEIMNIKKEKFYQETSLCGANFRGKSAESELSSDKIAIILRVYDDLNPDWLLLGKGKMLRSQSAENTGIEVQNNQNTIETQINNIRDMSEHIHGLIDTQTKYLKLLEKENERLLQENERLQQQINKLKKQ